MGQNYPFFFTVHIDTLLPKKNKQTNKQTNKHIPTGLCPNCLQTTEASILSHPSSQTVPHALLMHTSTLPSPATFPLRSRIAPSVQDALGRVPAVQFTKYKLDDRLFSSSNNWVKLTVTAHWSNASWWARGYFIQGLSTVGYAGFQSRTLCVNVSK